jgi:heme A synthase
MMTLATLVVAVQRAGGLGADVVTGPSDAGAPTYRGARAAAGLAFIVVVLGALTANVPGAALSCGGFPWCRTGVFVQGTPLHIQLTHRVLAILLFLHLGAGTVLVMRRGASRQVVAAAQITFGVVVLQLVVAAALVELRLPPALQSLHQAVGTLLWVTTFTYAAIARRAFLAHTGPAPSVAARGAAA